MHLAVPFHPEVRDVGRKLLPLFVEAIGETQHRFLALAHAHRIRVRQLYDLGKKGRVRPSPDYRDAETRLHLLGYCVIALVAA
jgi:hypothetical protein